MTHTQIQGCLRASEAVMRLLGLMVSILLIRSLASGVTVSHSGDGNCQTISKTQTWPTPVKIMMSNVIKTYQEKTAWIMSCIMNNDDWWACVFWIRLCKAKKPFGRKFFGTDESKIPFKNKQELKEAAAKVWIQIKNSKIRWSHWGCSMNMKSPRPFHYAVCLDSPVMSWFPSLPRQPYWTVCECVSVCLHAYDCTHIIGPSLDLLIKAVLVFIPEWRVAHQQNV